jgi:hypothetical protein
MTRQCFANQPQGRRRLLVLSTISAVLACGILFPVTLHAAPLAPSGILFPVPAGPVPGGVVVAGPLVVNVAPATFQGTLTSEVLAGDPTNPLGGLTFLYSVANTSPFPGQIERLTVSSFVNFATDVDFALAGGPVVTPTYADRSAFGDTIGFSFVTAPVGLGVIQPGQSSALLVVYTNAQQFQPTLASLIDGSVAQAASFAPVKVIPEPSTIILASLGGLGLLALRRRSR